MKSWSKPKKVMGILGILVFVFLTAYVVKNIDLYNHDDDNDTYTEGIWKCGNYFYMIHYDISPSSGTQSVEDMKGCIIKISENGFFIRIKYILAAVI